MSQQNAYNYDHYKNDHYLIKINKGYKCICELCNCGRHKCPKKQIKPSFETSYQNQYNNPGIIPITYKQRQQIEERHYNPESLRTNYRDTYIPKPLEQQLPASRMQQIGKTILKSNQPFATNSSYNEEYKPFIIQTESKEELQNIKLSRSSSINRSKNKIPIKFQGQSSYRAQYHEQPIPIIRRYKHPEYKSRPFVGESSYKKQYISYKLQSQIPQFLTPTIRSKSVKFEGTSTYSSNYKSYKIMSENNVKNECLVDKYKLPQSKTNNLNHLDNNSNQII